MKKRIEKMAKGLYELLFYPKYAMVILVTVLIEGIVMAEGKDLAAGIAGLLFFLEFALWLVGTFNKWYDYEGKVLDKYAVDLHEHIVK